MANGKLFLLSAGGTGGHLFPPRRWRMSWCHAAIASIW
jgi:hypothetical protein